MLASDLTRLLDDDEKGAHNVRTPPLVAQGGVLSGEIERSLIFKIGMHRFAKVAWM